MNRALLVGINAYPGNELRGCVNDVTDMADHLVKNCDFKVEDIRLLVDERATTAGIRERLDWLVGGLKPGDRVLFHYSGHGAQFPVRDAQGDVLRVDECICPVDFDWSIAHALRDKQFYEIFSSVPEDVEFIWVSDSCYSGDMARVMMPKGRKAKMMPMPQDIAWRLRTAQTRRLKLPGFVHVMKDFHVALVSGCTATQTSADAAFGPEDNLRYNGALTRYLLDRLAAADGSKQSLLKVVTDIRAKLRTEGFDQEPQIEGAGDLVKHPFLYSTPTTVPGATA